MGINTIEKEIEELKKNKKKKIIKKMHYLMNEYILCVFLKQILLEKQLLQME